MRGRLLPSLVWLILLLSSARTMVAIEAAETPLQILDAGTATVEVGSRRIPVYYSLTPLGPLVSLDPLVRLLGGELRVGPLEQSHELQLEGTSFVFGPDSSVVTSGEEIISLTQAPARGIHGLQVPLDLLETAYAEILGYEFRWQSDSRTLAILQRPVRDLPVEVDLVHLQGVTTVVLQFPQQPRYRIHQSPGRVEVEILGDRLGLKSGRPLPADQLVREVSLANGKILMSLVGDAVAKSYVLRQPFRLVFDVYRDRTARAPIAAPPQPPRRRGGLRTIVIDPGHGGADTGAVGPSGVMEKDLTLALGEALRGALTRRLPVKVVLTRGEDAELPPDTRASLANQQKADLFISIHLNSGPSSRAHGAETYFSSLVASDAEAARAAELHNQGTANPGDPLDDLQLILWDLAQSHYLSESQRLAAIIQDELNQALGLRNRGVKQAPFRVLVGAAMPAVLVELGFLNNPEEEAKLLQPAYREQLIDALVRAVIRFRAGRETEVAAVDEALR